MSFFKNVKEFFHNVTTKDHYAQYQNDNAQHSPSPRRGNTPLNNGSQLSFQNNASTTSLVAHPRPSTSSNNTSNNNSNTVYNNSNGNKSNNAIPYKPGMRSQLHNDSQIELRNYENGQPIRDIEEIWESIDNWLDREFPELGDDMEGGATANDLNAFENDLGVSLPSSFRDSYQIHDGQVSMGKTRGLIFTYPLMDLETIAAETNIWRRVYERFEKKEPSVINSAFGLQKSCPPKFINEIYYDPLWIPFVKDNVGNNIAIDLNPSELGKWGQVILFGRDYNTKFVVADSFNEFLLNLSNELLNGNYEIDEDEDLVFTSNGTSYNYFDVLKAKSIARAKQINPNYNVNDKNINDPELVQKKRNVVGLNIKSEENNTTNNVPSKPTTTSNTENLTNETLISPAHPYANKGKRDFTPSKENIATNDSFLIDDEEVELEVEADVKPKEEEILQQEKEVKEDILPVQTERAEEEAKEAKAAEIPAQEIVEGLEDVKLDETLEEPSKETEVVEAPAAEPVEPVEPVEEPTQGKEEAKPVDDVEETEEADAEVTADADADADADDTTEDVQEAETTDSKSGATTNKKKNKKNKKKGKK